MLIRIHACMGKGGRGIAGNAAASGYKAVKRMGPLKNDSLFLTFVPSLPNVAVHRKKLEGELAFALTTYTI